MEGILSSLKFDDPSLAQTIRECSTPEEAFRALKGYEESLDARIRSYERKDDPERVINELHRYNDLKDFAQQLIGALANLQGVTFAEIHQRHGLDNLDP